MIIAAAGQSGWTTAAIATIVASIVSGAIALVTFWANGVRQERSRRQQLYADALAALVSYREFAYVIRRRRAPSPGQGQIAGEERVRISEALREVQKDLAYFTAWIKAEGSEDLATSYEQLVVQTRRIAGGYMRDAWNSAPLDDDKGMNIPDIDYGPLAEHEQAYLDAVGGALGFWRIALPGLAKL